MKLDERVGIAAASEAVGRYDAILLAVPSQHLRAAAACSHPTLAAGTPVIACAKGIERGTHKFMTEVIAESAPQRAAGDPVGSELRDRRRARPADRGDARGVATASRRDARAQRSARRRSGSITPTDMRGVEIGGAAKNVLAIAAGIVTGRRLGASAAAALTTRGFAELFRFGQGIRRTARDLDGSFRTGRPDPDLLERAVAQLFAWDLRSAKAGRRSRSRADGKLAEGVFTAPVLVKMAHAKGIEMPIASAVADILDGRIGVERCDREFIDATISCGGIRWAIGC